jgi:alpha-methylacyl-CoA racemase
LAYVRLTGFGQQGPMAQEAGHDINFLAVSGVLDAIGRAGQPPTPPLNLVGDYGGGAMLAVVGALAAVLQARRTGRGQVVDASMCDGAMLLNSASYAFAPTGPRGTNLLDSGAPFYEVYECADGRHLAVGAILDKFWLALLRVLGLSESARWRERREADWPELKRELAAVFARRTLGDWIDEFSGVAACVTPVLRRDELAAYPHHVARQALVNVDGADVPAPAPRFADGPMVVRGGAPKRGEHTVELLRGIGYPQSRIDELLASGTVYRP